MLVSLCVCVGVKCVRVCLCLLILAKLRCVKCCGKKMLRVLNEVKEP